MIKNIHLLIPNMFLTNLKMNKCQWVYLFKKKSEEIRDLTVNDIGQKLGTLGRHMGHWADIKSIKQKLGTFGRHTGHLADIVNIGEIGDNGQTYGTLGRNWADIGQILGKH
jgi:hypothetical protein